MTEAAVGSLLENMVQLINSNNELILKAYEEKVIEKEHIESLYEDMQFLLKFLKDSRPFIPLFFQGTPVTRKRLRDHEELKSIVSKIRDVSYKTEDIIDWFLLKTVILQQRDGRSTASDFDPLMISTSSKNILDKAQKISESFKHMVEEISSIQKCKTEVLGMLSWLQSDMAHKICDGFGGVIEEIKPIIKEAMNILHKGSSLRWLKTNVFAEGDWWNNRNVAYRLNGYFCQLFEEKIREVDHLLLNMSSEKIPQGGFGGIIREIKLIIRQVLENIDKRSMSLCLKFSLPAKIAGLCHLSLKKIGEVEHLLNSSSKEIHSIKEIKSIVEEVIEIHENLFPDMIRWSDFSLYNEKISPLFIRLSRANICKVGLLYHESAEVPYEFDRLYRFSTLFSYLPKKICDCHDIDTSDWSQFCLAEDYRHLFSTYEAMSVLGEKIRHIFGSITEEIKPIKTKVMKIYEKGLSNPWINSQMTREFLLLLNLSIKLVDLAEELSHSFGSVIEDTNSIKTEVMKIYQQGLRLSWLESVMLDEIHKWFAIVTEEIKSIKREVMKIYEKKMYGIGVLRGEKSSHGDSSIPTTFKVKEELIVGFDGETETIMELLNQRHDSRLKVIPIIGMPGLGKTTLAMKVYNNPLIQYKFPIRAWTHVSQVYWRRDLLLRILSSADIQLKGKIEKMSDEELGEGLYKRLKGQKYLVVMDDIWELRAWNDIKRYFPNDNNGSGIIFTSRHGDVALSLPAEPHYLRFLDSDESWVLLQQKVFQGDSCPQELIAIRKQIAKKCQGLPLAIVVIAGLLTKEDKTQTRWRHVAESVSSYIVTEPEQFMDTLALSYNHLPYHLKPCFLYFGAFPEDYEIPVWKLIWLWVAEGFIVRNQQKSLEAVAEDYMMELIDRSLVIVSKKRSNGGIKTCRVHDLLRDLCLRKAQEDNFLMQVSSYERTFSSSSPTAKKQRRICISTHVDFYNILTLFNGCGYSKHGDPEVRSFSSTTELPLFYLLSFCSAFKLLRVLNISSVKISSFPEGLQLLVHLRYLSIHIDKEYFQPSVFNLWKLETFILEGGPTGCVSFSHDIWKMVKLRHLYTKQFIEIPHVPNDNYPFMLVDLQTICKLDLCGVDEQVLRRIPNLSKLTCSFMELLGGNNIFPKLDFLVHLETLKVTYGGFRGHLGRFPCLDEFPPNLKSLTLSNFCLSWEEMSTLGRLPNLEVLKLSYKAFEGPRWDTSVGLIHKLKFLRFQRLDIKQWNASGSSFPVLKTLVLDDCKQLKEIPSGLRDIFTLEMILLWYCSSPAARSAWQIQDWQQRMGYDGLKIQIYPWNNEDDDEDMEDDEDMGDKDDTCRG
ncbi:putative late blight resistance protein homolog R1B-8 [Cornus florida]|uniref:putative late blight resistance protein homolog R1B-8 n=1 Tax=Cornus florida TaxID=4283 RepID=UPI00289E86CD|nr:putative late blight resistance protein homolog R1B-8 [Cornus florida]XP_059642453.1 putative late blight resistance protein homolog R1B-8 [Cornus florida]XP_059642454.1 putative late blight resistance protein homolog R1B-8 [Cornus florida]